MRKIFNKVLAGITATALIATLLVGINVTTAVKAEEEAVALSNWSFIQGGQYNPSEPGNEGFINSVKMNGSNETINGWLRAGEASVNQKQTASQAATGFSIDIANTGWDATWEANPVQINPWSIQALMEDTAIKPGHVYTVSFKAHATKKKYAYVSFGCDVEGTTPYGDDLVEGSNSVIALTTQDQTFTYTFGNWVSASKLTTTLMLGAFDAQYDYAGNNISDIVTEVENGWSGTVYVSDFTITDKGPDPTFVTDPPKPTTPPTQPTTNNTVKPTTPSTPVTPTKPSAKKKLAKVKKLKAVNKKKGTVKITWRKVAKAKKYQVKVGKKTYSTKKATLTVKKLKKGKKVTIKVRATATGYTSSAWATKKIKIKK